MTEQQIPFDARTWIEATLRRMQALFPDNVDTPPSPHRNKKRWGEGRRGIPDGGWK